MSILFNTQDESICMLKIWNKTKLWANSDNFVYILHFYHITGKKFNNLSALIMVWELSLVIKVYLIILNNAKFVTEHVQVVGKIQLLIFNILVNTTTG